MLSIIIHGAMREILKSPWNSIILKHHYKSNRKMQLMSTKIETRPNVHIACNVQV